MKIIYSIVIVVLLSSCCPHSGGSYTSSSYSSDESLSDIYRHQKRNWHALPGAINAEIYNLQK